jgi:hypothetical protein
LVEKIDLDADNVVFVEITTTQARAIDVDSELPAGEEVNTALDNAQAKAFTGEHEISYLVIKIKMG